MYTVIVFSSRNETMKFFNIFKMYGVFCTIINSPRSLSHSCGISVRIDKSGINVAKTILQKNSFYTYKGIFLVERVGIKENVHRVW